jgi:hypothetical protein
MEERGAARPGWVRIGAGVVGAALLVLAPIAWFVAILLSEEGWETNEPLRVLGSVIALSILGMGGFALGHAVSGGYGRIFWAMTGITTILVVIWLFARDACTQCGIP